ncbi:ABC transporter permease [Streptomyces sp. NBRC 109706]|uniref:ABC transporter permease n=1 Tax=Streptomyces sp. NBRC 109706 TaxID=1550035 RepID=UPI00099C10F5|nr:ABC transporter permease [Streptomyces sp. NBRC 109706]
MTTMTERPPRAQSAVVAEISRELRLGRRRARVTRLVLSVATPVALLLLWEVLSRSGALDARFFPPPTEVADQAAAFVTDAEQRSDLLHNLSVSGVRLFAGFAIGALAGFVVGLAMGLSKLARDALDLLINATYPLPKLTLFPLMIIFFGIGDASKIALVALGVFYMLAINTALGVRQSNPVYGDVSTAFRLPLWTRFRRVVVPAALPSILAGMRLGFGQALILVVSTEFLSSNDGIGYFIWNSWQVLDVPAMFVGLAIVGVVGGLSAWAFNALGQWLAPWAEQK